MRWLTDLFGRWVVEQLSAGTGWLRVPRSRRLAWAGILVVELLALVALAAVAASPLGLPGAAWVVAAVAFLAFSGFVLALSLNPMRTASEAPRILFLAGLCALAVAAVVVVIRAVV